MPHRGRLGVSATSASMPRISTQGAERASAQLAALSSELGALYRSAMTAEGRGRERAVRVELQVGHLGEMGCNRRAARGEVGCNHSAARGEMGCNHGAAKYLSRLR